MFIDGMVKSTEVVVHSKTNFVKIVQNQLLLRKPLTHQLILQDRHVTYREIDITLGVSRTSIHTILHEHLTVKKIILRWIPHNLSIAQRKAHVGCSKEMLQKYDRNASKHV